MQSIIIYRIVKHGAGWAYEVNGTSSARFRTRHAARHAAKVAAHEHARAQKARRLDYETGGVKDERARAKQ